MKLSVKGLVAALGMVAASAASLAATAATTVPGEVTYDGIAIEASLTGVPGDAAKGRQWAMDRKLGNCLACHANSDMNDQPFHGEVGPPLDGAGSRWNAAELRGIVVNSKQVFGDATIMPAFYRDSGFNRTLGDFEGQTILDAQQVEDIVAYLLTLQE